MNSLRVLSYNIHKGFALGGKKFVIEQIREKIRELNPDIVFLQEVTGENKINKKKIKNYPTPLFEYLAEDFWPYFAYGKNFSSADAHHGNALLSKYKIESWSNLNLSTNRWERRGLLHSLISLPDSQTLHALNLHLDLGEHGRRLQIEKVIEYIKTIPNQDKILLAGDFNDWRERITPRLKKELTLEEIHLQLHKKHARSFPSFFPLLKLDRIYFRNLIPKNAYSPSDVSWKQLSDHSALYAEFAF